jgi:pyruvate dehydrogenase (quinone)
MKTVADQFADTLAAAGVKRIYDIVGDCLNGLTDAPRRKKVEGIGGLASLGHNGRRSRCREN